MPARRKHEAFQTIYIHFFGVYRFYRYDVKDTANSLIGIH